MRYHLVSDPITDRHPWGDLGLGGSWGLEGEPPHYRGVFLNHPTLEVQGYDKLGAPHCLRIVIWLTDAILR